jgi:hypothetical protein
MENAVVLHFQFFSFSWNEAFQIEKLFIFKFVRRKIIMVLNWNGVLKVDFRFNCKNFKKFKGKFCISFFQIGRESFQRLSAFSEITCLGIFLWIKKILFLRTNPRHFSRIRDKSFFRFRFFGLSDYQKEICLILRLFNSISRLNENVSLKLESIAKGFPWKIFYGQIC